MSDTGSPSPVSSVRRLMVVLAWMTVSAAQAEAPTPGELLGDMARASQSLNYDGVFIYRRGDVTETLRIIHRGAPGGEAERLVSLSGPKREVIRDAEGTRCYVPETDRGLVERRRPRRLLPSSFAPPVDVISRSYVLELVGTDRIGGHEAWVVAVQPKSGHRYGYRFWLHRDTGLLLGSTVVDQHGQPLEQMMFTQVEMPATIADDLLQPSAEAAMVVHHDNAHTTAQTRTAGWRVNWTPVGFELEADETITDDSRREPYGHIVYSDVLSVFSVFVEHLHPTTEPPYGYANVGAMTAFTHPVGEYVVTVVGELPPPTVRRIALSVAPSTSAP